MVHQFPRPLHCGSGCFFLVSVYVRVFAGLCPGGECPGDAAVRIFIPGAGRPRPWIWDAMKESAWQVLYGLVLLFPVPLAGAGADFLILSPAPRSLIGAFYYWRISLELIPQITGESDLSGRDLAVLRDPGDAGRCPLHFWGMAAGEEAAMVNPQLSARPDPPGGALAQRPAPRDLCDRPVAVVFDGGRVFGGAIRWGMESGDVRRWR